MGSSRLHMLPGVSVRICRWLVLALTAVLWLSPAAAQEEATGEITVKAQWVGVGGAVRPGDWAGIRLTLSDTGSRQREVLVRIALPDGDGDRVVYERPTTTNPGVAQPLWMYLRVPMRTQDTEVLNVLVHAAEESLEIEEGWGAGRLLGSAQVRLLPANLVPRSAGMIGVVGNGRMGLNAYQGDYYQASGNAPPFELTRIVDGINADGLPDRWMGLMPLEAIVWKDGQPSSLGVERAQALREWVLRGGHLIVVLPRVGETWTNEASNPLYDISPRVKVTRREGVDITPYAPLFTRRTDLVSSVSGEVVQTFEPLPGAQPSEAASLLTGPDGATLVVRRTVGTGAVTYVGLDIASTFMASKNLPEAELFWHRVLGRRGRVAFDQREEGPRVRTLVGHDNVPLDSDLPAQISKTGQASTGVFAGFLLFVVYWLIAGPLGYAMLSRAGRKRHAWVAFVAAAAVFTGVAWGGARIIRPGRVESTHLTYVDHVYGQDVERARSWVSLLIPEYGESTVSLEDPAREQRSRFRNAIAPWDTEERSGNGFPDSKSYTIDCRDPYRVTVPTRATVKQFQVDWAGGTGWQTPRPVTREDGSPGAVNVVERGSGLGLEGVLVHGLPGPMRDVYVVVNFGQRNITRSFAGAGASSMTANVATFYISEWKPGDPLDLSMLQQAPGAPDLFKEFLSPQRVGRPNPAGVMDSGDSGRVATRMAALSFFSQIEVPDPERTAQVRDYDPVPERRYSHGWDLGRWFTQPSLMIVGQIGSGGEASPVPLYVGTGTGLREARSEGRTVLRWVCPLDARPPAFGARAGEEPQQPDETGGEGEAEGPA